MEERRHRDEPLPGYYYAVVWQCGGALRLRLYRTERDAWEAVRGELLVALDGQRASEERTAAALEALRAEGSDAAWLIEAMQRRQRSLGRLGAQRAAALAAEGAALEEVVWQYMDQELDNEGWTVLLVPAPA